MIATQNSAVIAAGLALPEEIAPWPADQRPGTAAIDSATNRIPSLDGLRAISIFMVVAGHWASVQYASQVALSYAYLGVRIFFIISGYLITTLLIKEQSRTSTISLGDFYLRRAYRILPAAMAFMLPVFVVYWSRLRWYDMTAAALYLANFDPLRPWFLGHLWSLSVEEQFYFVWPSVLKKWYQHRIGILAAVALFAPIFRLACYALKLPQAGNDSFPAVADNLAIGCLLAILAPRIPEIKPWLGFLMMFPVILVPTYLAVTRLHTLVLLFFLWPLLHLSVAGILLHIVRNPLRLLNLGPVVWLGKISYSLYLWQQLFAYNPHSRPWYAPLYALGLACLSYYLVEQPMLRMRQRRTRDRRSPAAATVPHPESERATLADSPRKSHSDVKKAGPNLSVVKDRPRFVPS
jgi:peptidoglycan/LPS O-acetylase OafA/YrhL